MMRMSSLWSIACIVVLALSSSALAAIRSVVETNLGADPAAIVVNGGFGEDAAALADRDHQHNGARFSDVFGAGTLSLAPVGFPESVVVNVPLPSYLVGGDYVRFSNDARDNVGYSATMTVGSSRAKWYLLVDNRVAGGSNDSTWYDSPTFGGPTQWVLDDGWQPVNTGITPAGNLFGLVNDYTGIDEFQNSDPGTLGVGPGILVDNFYAVYTLPNKSKSITTGALEIGGLTMYSVVAVVPEPASLAILACGVFGLAASRRARRR